MGVGAFGQWLLKGVDFNLILIFLGAMSFVSGVYEGAISDKELFKKSKIIDKINPGDLVMVDRGFNVLDILLEKGVDIVIPPFLGNRTHLSPQKGSQTCIIAKLLMHVEE